MKLPKLILAFFALLIIDNAVIAGTTTFNETEIISEVNTCAYGRNAVLIKNSSYGRITVEICDGTDTYCVDGWVAGNSYFTFNGINDGTTIVRVYKNGRCIKNRRVKLYYGECATIRV